MRAVLVVLFGLALTACHGSPSAQGEVGAHCYPNGTCNVTLTCVGGVCVAQPDAAVDAPKRDAAADAPPDAAYACNNDSSFGMNQSISNAFQTPVAITQKSVTYSTLAICPATESDYFRVDLTATQNVEAIVTYDDPAHGGGALQMEVDNQSGAALVVATPVMGMANTIRAYAANLPMASSPYYVHVASVSGREDNYSLTINVTP